MPNKKQSSVKTVSERTVDRKRSLAAKKGAATRARNREIAASRQLRLHHKLIAGGAIAAVVVLTFMAIYHELTTYAARVTAYTYISAGGKCIDNDGNILKNNNRVQLYTCNDTDAQVWKLQSTGAMKLNGGKFCLNVTNNSKVEKAYLRIKECNGASGQKFAFKNGKLINKATNFCVTPKNGGKTDYTRLWMMRCDKGKVQAWTHTTSSTTATNGGTTSGSNTGNSAGGTTRNDTPVTDPVGTTNGSGKFAKYKVPSRGWWSGASGNGIDGGSTAFGNWRGDTADAIATWIDAENGGAWGYAAGIDGGPIKGFKGLADIAIGGPTDYAAAANGSMDGKLTDLLKRIKAYRTKDAPNAPTVIRPFHEMNGNWYGHSVTPGNLANFKKTAKRWSQIAKQVYPEAIWEFSPNGESMSSSPSAAQLYENGVWDAIGVDRYNQYPYIGKNLAGATVTWEDGANRGTLDNPIGAEKWRQFAAARGVPIGFPEYANHGPGDGNNQQSGDDPYWVNNFFAWVKKNRGTGSGQVYSDIWFNQVKEGNKWHISGSPTTGQPNVAKAYANIFPVQ